MYIFDLTNQEKFKGTSKRVLQKLAKEKELKERMERQAGRGSYYARREIIEGCKFGDEGSFEMPEILEDKWHFRLYSLGMLEMLWKACNGIRRGLTVFMAKAMSRAMWSSLSWQTLSCLWQSRKRKKREGRGTLAQASAKKLPRPSLTSSLRICYSVPSYICIISPKEPRIKNFLALSNLYSSFGFQIFNLFIESKEPVCYTLKVVKIH